MLSKITVNYSHAHAPILDSFIVPHYESYEQQEGLEMKSYEYTSEFFSWPSKELYATLPSNMKVTEIAFGYRSA